MVLLANWLFFLCLAEGCGRIVHRNCQIASLVMVGVVVVHGRGWICLWSFGEVAFAWGWAKFALV